MNSREEIRKKYEDLQSRIVQGHNARSINEEFSKLSQMCSHPYGNFNYEIGCWSCPDCGFRNN